MDTDNPFYDFMKATPLNFIGRDDILRVILRGATDPWPNSYHMACFRGFGKSALLRFLAHPNGARKKKNHYLHRPYRENRLEIIYIDCAYYQSEVNFAAWIYEQLKSKSIIPKIDQTDPISNHIKHIKRVIASAKDFRYVLLLDHVDEIFGNIRTIDESNALRPLTVVASIVVASEIPLIVLNDMAYASWFGDSARELDWDPISPEESMDLIRCAFKMSGEGEINKARLFKRYYELPSMVGYHPSFILRAASELYDLQQKLPSIPDSALNQISKDRLISTFRGDYARYWRTINESQRESLIRLMHSTLRDKDYSQLEYLRDGGLVEWVEEKAGKHGHYKPFSGLWHDFLKEKAEDRTAEQMRIKEFGQHSNLTPRQRELFVYFQERPNTICSYKDILEHVWRRPVENRDVRLLRETVRQLRKKLEETNSGRIINRRGHGYEYILPKGTES